MNDKLDYQFNHDKNEDGIQTWATGVEGCKAPANPLSYPPLIGTRTLINQGWGWH